MAQTIKYNLTRDIALNVNGDWEVSGAPGQPIDLQMIGDDPAIVQAVNIRLQFILGEWFMDTSAGIPLYTEILVKNPDANQLTSIFRNAILSAPGITSVQSLVLNFDRARRNMQVIWKAIGTSDQLLSSTVTQQL